MSFDAEKPTIFFRTILRGLTKYLASRGAEKVGGKGLGLLANLLGAVTERADTRSWLTLPGQVHVLRLHLPPGRHDVKLELLGADRARGGGADTGRNRREARRMDLRIAARLRAAAVRRSWPD